MCEPVRPFEAPLGPAGMKSSGLALVKGQREVLERERSSDGDVLILGQLAVDGTLEWAELTLHQAVSKVVLDAGLAATPDATYLRREGSGS